MIIEETKNVLDKLIKLIFILIDEGDLNTLITVTYHDGDSTWQYGLCFKRARQPDYLIQSEANGTRYEFKATDLEEALKPRGDMEIVDY